MPHRSAPYVLVIGESVVDVVTDASGTKNVYPGGSAVNTAVALSRLGRSVELATAFADDAYGDLIGNHLALSGVALANDPHAIRRTSTASVKIGNGGAATHRFDVEWQLVPPRRPTPTVVHVCSVATLLMPGAAKALSLITRLRASATISYDINARPSTTGSGRSFVELVERTVSLSDIVKASDEDLGAIYPGLEPHSAARRLLALGPTAVVLTCGKDGAVWFSRGCLVEVPAYPVAVVDTIGAGDAFGAGVLDALWQAGQFGFGRLTGLRALPEPSIEAVLASAVRAAGVSVSHPGANPPCRNEMEFDIELP
jgi:fructokinase